MRNALDVFVEEKVAGSKTRWLEDMDELVECEDSMMKEQEVLVKEAHSRLHNYVSDEMKEDLPTG